MFKLPTLVKLSGWEVLRTLKLLEYSQEEVSRLISNLNLPVTLKAEFGTMHWDEIQAAEYEAQENGYTKHWEQVYEQMLANNEI